MPRHLAIVLILGSLWAAPAVASQEDFDAKRQAALDQVSWVERAYAERLGPRGVEWRQRVQADEVALRDSLDWFSRNAAGDHALRLAVPLAYFWTYEGRAEDARNLLTRILALPSALAQTQIRAKGLYDAGALALRQRDEAASRELTAESLRISRRLQDKEGIATALLGLSRAALQDMDYASVRRYAEESAVLRRELDDKPGQAAAMHMLASVARIQGQYGKAAELYQFSLAANREAGWDRPVAEELFNLGYVRLRQGNVDAARKLFTESLEKYRDLQDDAGIACTLTGFASIAVAQKQPSRAARLYGAALAILEPFNVTLNPDDQLDIDHYTARLLTLIAPAVFKAATAEGRTTSPERAIALALGAP